MSPETASVISQVAASVVVVALFYGILKRRDRAIHIPVMIACFAVDLANVLFIELSRLLRGEEGAVSKASGELLAGVPTILFVHIIASILTIVGYVVATWSGFRLHRRGIGRRLHRANAWAFVVVRLVTYSTSFFV